MRESLKQSIADSPVRNFERYPKGSIVLCNACAAPIFKLDYSIDLGDKAGKSAQAFKPIALADLMELEGRADIDAGVRARIKAWTPEEKRAHLACLFEPRAGEPMVCPSCHGCYVQVLTVEKSETHDRAYVIELVTIPPYGSATPAPVRGKRVGSDGRGGWLH